MVREVLTPILKPKERSINFRANNEVRSIQTVGLVRESSVEMKDDDRIISSEFQNNQDDEEIKESGEQLLSQASDHELDERSDENQSDSSEVEEQNSSFTQFQGGLDQ